MAKAMKVIREVWDWLERLAAKRAAENHWVKSQDVKARRREMMRRAAGQTGSY